MQIAQESIDVTPYFIDVTLTPYYYAYPFTYVKQV